MGFGDKLKGLKDQAQQAVAENRDKIQGAVQTVGDAANTKTHGKYATKIAKMGEKVETGVDKFAAGPEGAPQTAPTAAAGGSPEEPGHAPTPAQPVADPAQPAPDPAFSIEGDAPQQESLDAPCLDEPSNPVTPSAADTAKSGFPEFE